ncbi:uncharacterized protein MONBRDRAFT_28257 [Monosiga brevicollis MX1]|uniref:Uncharacterized protein n=1 Tax=Monosiga brevicollis TaxID=81824 RepID=A9V7M8_MONBE|nr:uncharacterized protein MONBRDRAFT_28257 [Monosiga brevicollis MX1]EDQ86404.1 predicted protein [Monosiga brevicollis MX1]|eukprot:XP_001748794.1 hypothetical protein [Monosiga brevicollis MX1]
MERGGLPGQGRDEIQQAERQLVQARNRAQIADAMPREPVFDQDCRADDQVHEHAGVEIAAEDVGSIAARNQGRHEVMSEAEDDQSSVFLDEEEITAQNQGRHEVMSEAEDDLDDMLNDEDHLQKVAFNMDAVVPSSPAPNNYM